MSGSGRLWGRCRRVGPLRCAHERTREKDWRGEEGGWLYLGKSSFGVLINQLALHVHVCDGGSLPNAMMALILETLKSSIETTVRMAWVLNCRESTRIAP